MFRKIKLIKKSRKGTTMVEVLVAFLVVMLMMGMFSKVVTASAGLLKRAGENIKKTEDFGREYLTINAQASRVSEGKIQLKLDSEATAIQNRAVDISLGLNGELQSYVYNNMTRYSFEIPELSQDQEDAGD